MGIDIFTIKLLSSFFDIESLITILAANLIKNPKYIYFWVIVSAFIGLCVSAAVRGIGGEDEFTIKLIAQMALGIFIIRSRRKRGAFDKVINNETARVSSEHTTEGADL